MSKDLKKYIAECIGTAILVFFGCGVAVITGGDIVPTALAFGLAIVAAAYAIGDISGCHVNPAVSLAMFLNKKLSGKQFCGYVIAQVVGALCGSLLLWAILALSGADKSLTGLGANSFIADNTAGMWGSILVEVILTFVFVYTILGVTSDKNKAHIAGIVIGLTLTFVHILGIGLTGTSVNPARSLAPAILLGGTAIKQVWVFVLAPLVGGALAAYTYRLLNEK
ncbi:MAG: aquaporin [Candidatus Saccharibacteria bacterium]|nr:aquaporin [Candidatus Saccharibacteria bacterium]